MNSLWPVLGTSQALKPFQIFHALLKKIFFFFLNSAPAKKIYKTELVCTFILSMCANFQNDQTVFGEPGVIIVCAISQYETLISSKRA